VEGILRHRWLLPLLLAVSVPTCGLLPGTADAAAAPAGDAAAGDPAASDPALQDEYERLFQKMLADPTDLDVTFQYAGIAARIGNYEAAIGAMERMLLLNPDLPRVKLELGVLYFKLGSYEVSKSYFNDAIAGAEVPPLVRLRVQAYLDAIDRAQSRSHLAGSVSFGVNYQTNANAAPSGPEVKLLGFDAVLGDDFLANGDFSLFASGFAEHTYDLRTDPGVIWDTTGVAYFAKQIELDDLDLGFVEVTTGPRITAFAAEDGDLTVRPYVLGNVVTLGDDVNFTTAGGGIEFIKPFGDRLGVSAAYVFRHKMFHDSEERPVNHFMSSDEHSFEIGARYLVTDTIQLSGGARFVIEDAKKAFNSNDEDSVYATARWIYRAPWDLTDWPWEAAITGQYLWTDYSEPEPIVDPAESRSDREYRVIFTNAVGLTEDWSVYTTVEYDNNASNLPNFDFENVSTILGGSWRF
jgi:hypothetical protein